jgi:hypothetical protein
MKNAREPEEAEQGAKEEEDTCHTDIFWLQFL